MEISRDTKATVMSHGYDPDHGCVVYRLSDGRVLSETDIDRELTEYARLTSGDMDASVDDAVRAMRDEPGEVDAETRIPAHLVVAWCDRQRAAVT